MNPAPVRVKARVAPKKKRPAPLVECRPSSFETQGDYFFSFAAPITSPRRALAVSACFFRYSR